MAAQKILLTGAAGFIGGSLLERLTRLDFDCLGVDNFSPYYNPKIKQLHIQKEGIASLVRISDISNFTELESVYRAFNPDIVINLAAQGGVRASQLDPTPYIISNQLGFFNVLQLNNKYKVKLFLYASSSSVYGDGLIPPFSEDSQLPAPKSLYAASKLSNELMAQHFPLDSGPRIGLRFFTVYGPWGRPDMAVSRLISSALAGKKFTLTANYTLKRDFTFIDDLNSSILGIIKNKNFHQAQNQILNIACESPRSMGELIQICADLGLNVDISKGQLNSTDVLITHGSTKKLEDLGVPIPRTSLESGLAQTIMWMKALSNQELRLFLV